MKTTKLQEKLLAAARCQPPGDAVPSAVPYAFEKRIMARIHSIPARDELADELALWASALWRAAASCCVIMVALGVWSFLPVHTPESPEFSQEFENTVFADMGQHIQDSW